MGERRNKRLEEVVKEELSKIIYKNLDCGSDVLVTLTRLELSPDASCAKAWISVMPEKNRNSIMQKIKFQLPYFQHLLIKKIPVKWVPEIVLVDDTSEEEAAKIEQLIDESNFPEQNL